MANNNHRPWQPPPDPKQGPPPSAISIQDIVSMYGFLVNLTSEPSETRKTIIANLETVIHNFSQSLAVGVNQ